MFRRDSKDTWLMIRQITNKNRGNWEQTSSEVEEYLNTMASLEKKSDAWGHITVQIPTSNTAEYDTCYGFARLENNQYLEEAAALLDNRLYLGRYIAVKVNDRHEGGRTSTIKQEERSRSASRTRYVESTTASKRKSEEESDESRALKNKVAKLTVQVKEIELEALKIGQARQQEEEKRELKEIENLQLRAELEEAYERIKELAQENELLRRKQQEPQMQRAREEARKAVEEHKKKEEAGSKHASN